MIQKYLWGIDKISFEDEILCFTVRNNVVLCVNHISLISAKKERMVAILSCWCKSFYQQFRRGEHASVSLESTPLWFAKGLFKILSRWHGLRATTMHQCVTTFVQFSDCHLITIMIIFSTKKKFAALLDYVCQKKEVTLHSYNSHYDSFGSISYLRR